MKSRRFLNDRICLNVLASDIDNAKEIVEATEGHVVVGLLSANYLTTEAAVADMQAHDKVLDGAVSVGLGAGDPNQWSMVADICKTYTPEHVNQVFTAIGQTRTSVNNDSTFINCLVHPLEESDYVDVATGPLSSGCEPVKAPIESAIAMIRDMGGNSIKFFPMNGLQSITQYKSIARACAEENFALEPTGGLDLDNFEEIVTVALEAGVQKIIPHVYSSIIDKTTGKTKIADVKKLYEIMKRLGKQYG